MFEPLLFLRLIIPQHNHLSLCCCLLRKTYDCCYTKTHLQNYEWHAHQTESSSDITPPPCFGFLSIVCDRELSSFTRHPQSTSHIR